MSAAIAPNGRRLGLRSGIKKRIHSARTNIIKNIKHQATTMPLWGLGAVSGGALWSLIVA